MSQVDSAELFHVLLANEASVADEVTDGAGVHIYGPPGLPENFELRKAIMYIGDGGVGNVNIPLGEDEFEVYCYGTTAREARQVYLALFNYLHRKKHVRVTLEGGETAILQYAQKLSGPQDRTEPSEGWPYVFCSFYVHFIETTIP